MLRLHLPPNFAAAVVRNAVPLRVELDLSQPPAPELLPVLALLQRWCGTPTPPQFIQLNRAQLRELAAAAGTQSIFLENGQLTWWRHADLLGQAEFEQKETGATKESVLRPPSSAVRPSAPPPLRPPSSDIRPSVPPSAAVRPPTPGSGLGVPRSEFRVRSSASTPMSVDGSEHFLAVTLPSREHPQYADALALLKENGFTLEPSNRKWWLRDRHKVLNFLASNLSALRGRFGAELTPNFEKNTARIQPAEVTADIGTTGGGFSVAVAVRAGDTDEGTLRAAIAANRGYVETNGRIFLLDAARLQKLAVAQRALAGDPNAGIAPQRTFTVSPARTAEVQDVLEELSPNFQPPDAWRQRSTALRNLTALQPAPLRPELEALLRPYQRLGIAWLWHLQRHGLGGILADEMGLGKTLQALALLAAAQLRGASAPLKVESTELKDEPESPQPASERGGFQPFKSQISNLKSTAPSAVICPASLLENWRREAVRFTPHLRVFVHHGSNRLARPADFAAYDLVITSYGTLTRDQALFTGVEFGCVIADEAQHIKNRRSQNAAALRALHARSRFVLTGTPVENSLDDLRSLFEFLLPGYLTRVPGGLRREDRAWYDERLRAQTAPYILRRTKKSVAPELPDKIEQVLWCELTDAQAALYRETQERSERELIDLEAAGASESKLKFAALTQLLRLRQICCDPRLVRAAVAPAGTASDLGTSDRTAADRGASDCRASVLQTPPSLSATDNTRKASALPPASDPDGTASGSRPPSAAAGGAPDLDDETAARFADSAKLAAFRELLEEAVDDGHRILVFSQFTSLLALLRAELDARETPYCYLDGSMPASARQAQVDRFQRNGDVPLFLLSLKAGGTGLNLTGADTVVIYDPWWNPAAEAQATDRAHRIGQQRTVTSYKLIAAGTVEEKVLALQAEKRALLADVFEASDAAAAKLSLADLRDLLKA